jgi:hypothetical protein
MRTVAKAHAATMTIPRTTRMLLHLLRILATTEMGNLAIPRGPTSTAPLYTQYRGRKLSNSVEKCRRDDSSYGWLPVSKSVEYRYDFHEITATSYSTSKRSSARKTLLNVPSQTIHRLVHERLGKTDGAFGSYDPSPTGSRNRTTPWVGIKALRRTLCLRVRQYK